MDQEPSSELVGDFMVELAGRKTCHPLEFSYKVRLVIIVVVEFVSDFVVWDIAGPVPIKFLKTEYPRQHLW